MHDNTRWLRLSGIGPLHNAPDVIQRRHRTRPAALSDRGTEHAVSKTTAGQVGLTWLPPAASPWWSHSRPAHVMRFIGTRNQFMIEARCSSGITWLRR